jgi:uncharacterized protein YdaU (DUF1376 family)
MPFYVNDFRMDTLDLETEEVGVYMLLLCLCWQRDDAALPNDMDWLKRSLKSCVANFHGHTFNRIVPKLLKRYFILFEDGKYRNKRLANERQKADKLSAKQKQNADKRWADYNHFKEIGHATAIPGGNANAMPSQPHKNITSVNFESEAVPPEEHSTATATALFEGAPSPVSENPQGSKKVAAERRASLEPSPHLLALMRQKLNGKEIH